LKWKFFRLNGCWSPIPLLFLSPFKDSLLEFMIFGWFDQSSFTYAESNRNKTLEEEVETWKWMEYEWKMNGIWIRRKCQGLLVLTDIIGIEMSMRNCHW
jgi:hypothetical protein